jgi:hypothetical protein
MTMLGSKNDSNNGSQLSSGSATEVPMPSSAPTDDLPF